MSTPSLRLARQELFKTPSRSLTEDQHIELGYERGRVSAAEYGESFCLHDWRIRKEKLKLTTFS